MYLRDSLLRPLFNDAVPTTSVIYRQMCWISDIG